MKVIHYSKVVNNVLSNYFLRITDSGGNSVSEVGGGGGGGGGGGQSFTNFRQHYIALLGLRLHIALRKPL